MANQKKTLDWRCKGYGNEVNNNKKSPDQGFVDHSSVVNLARKPTKHPGSTWAIGSHDLRLIKAYQPYQIQSTNPNPGCFVETAKNTINDGWDDIETTSNRFQKYHQVSGFPFSCLGWERFQEFTVSKAHLMSKFQHLYSEARRGRYTQVKHALPWRASKCLKFETYVLIIF